MAKVNTDQQKNDIEVKKLSVKTRKKIKFLAHKFNELEIKDEASDEEEKGSTFLKKDVKKNFMVRGNGETIDSGVQEKKISVLYKPKFQLNLGSKKNFRKNRKE